MASHAKKSAKKVSTPKSEGDPLHIFVGLPSIDRTQETRMITYQLLGRKKPINTNDDKVPFMHELDEDMELPESKPAFNPAADMKDLTIKAYYTAKTKTLPTWKLMDFQEFMSLCRKAQHMCQSSARKGAAVNAAAIGELMDVCLRTHRTMERLGELGPDSIRFKARMYLHLQYMCTHRVFHASAIAMMVFADVADPFAAWLPARRGINRQRHVCAAAATSVVSSYRKPAVKIVPPISGCYKCPAKDHYANDTRFHPLLPDGSQEKLSDETKAVMMRRIIDTSTLLAAVKAVEKDKVRQYWSQHKL